MAYISSEIIKNLTLLYAWPDHSIECEQIYKLKGFSPNNAFFYYSQIIKSLRDSFDGMVETGLLEKDAYSKGVYKMSLEAQQIVHITQKFNKVIELNKVAYSEIKKDDFDFIVQQAANSVFGNFAINPDYGSHEKNLLEIALIIQNRQPAFRSYINFENEMKLRGCRKINYYEDYKWLVENKLIKTTNYFFFTLYTKKSLKTLQVQDLVDKANQIYKFEKNKVLLPEDFDETKAEQITPVLHELSEKKAGRFYMEEALEVSEEAIEFLKKNFNDKTKIFEESYNKLFPKKVVFNEGESIFDYLEKQFNYKDTTKLSFYDWIINKNGKVFDWIIQMIAYDVNVNFTLEQLEETAVNILKNYKNWLCT